MDTFRRLLGAQRSTPSPQIEFSAPLAPDYPFIAIGDIHGCEDLLLRLIDQIDASFPHTPLLCVGDYVDRGDASANVLELLYNLAQQREELFQCLSGNHEEMLLKFIDDPAKYGKRWLRYGGLQTLASYGVSLPQAYALEDARDALVSKMDSAVIEWLRTLPKAMISGNVAIVHAGADPSMPMNEQSDRVLHWGHPDFETRPRQDGIWVVHGHTIVPEPIAEQGRIAIDTGAYATGVLSAVRIEAGNCAFLKT